MMTEREASRLYYLADLLVSDPAHAGELVGRALAKAQRTSSDAPEYRRAVELLSESMGAVAWSDLDATAVPGQFRRIADGLLNAELEASKDAGQALHWALRNREHREYRGEGLARLQRPAAAPDALEQIDLLKSLSS